MRREELTFAERVAKAVAGVPEDKRPMFSALAGAYIDGMIAQEQLAAAERPGA